MPVRKCAAVFSHISAISLGRQLAILPMLALVFLPTMPLKAQSYRGSIRGVVLD